MKGKKPRILLVQRRTVVSTIVMGAGSVAVSERPTLPNTVSTSGKLFKMRSWCCGR